MTTSHRASPRRTARGSLPVFVLPIALLLLLAGCASGPGTVSAPSTPASVPPEETGRYETVPGREPALVADLRAAPAPATPEIVDGNNAASDEKRLRPQSLMRIGTSHFAASDANARGKAVRQAERVGADRVIVYAPAPGDGDLVVAYYVRFRLPFGATFRDLRAAERTDAAASGGVAIGTVVDGSPASRANLLAGDIVVKCDDAPIVGRSDFQNMLRAKAGHPVTLTIVRNGESLQRVVRLGPLTTGS
jgi:membrane-associated protease RseP (regulator of RpoE activity)